MRTDSNADKCLLWLAKKPIPHDWSQRLLWRVQDHRLDKAMAANNEAAKALRSRKR